MVGLAMICLNVRVFFRVCHPAKEMGREKSRGSAEKNEAKCWLRLILLGRSSSGLMFVCLKGLVITFGTCYSVEWSLASGRQEMEFTVLLTRQLDVLVRMPYLSWDGG